MLVSPKIQSKPDLEMLLSIIGQNSKHTEIEPGIFLTGSFSFGNFIENKKNEYYDFKKLSPYGVCDNLDQVKRKYKKWLNDPELKFCISFTEVKKSEEPAEGGWRWHKWGPYIGNKNPQYEYLYDEDGSIQNIYCYHIYQLLD